MRHLRIIFLLQLLCVGYLGAQTLSRVSGNGQIVFERFPAKEPLVVQAKNAAGNPVAGVPITWTVTPTASASLNQTINITDENGFASTGILAPVFLQGETYISQVVTAASPTGSVSFNLTSVTERLPNGNFAGDPFISLDSPPIENRNVTGKLGATIPGGVVVKSLQSGYRSPGQSAAAEHRRADHKQ